MTEASVFTIIFTSIPLSIPWRCCLKNSRTYRLSRLRTTALPTLFDTVIPSRVCPIIPLSKIAKKCRLYIFRFFSDSLRKSDLFRIRFALLKECFLKSFFFFTFPSGKAFRFSRVITCSVSSGKSLSSFGTTPVYHSSARFGGHAFQKSMVTGPFDPAWLKCSFHLQILFLNYA